MLSNQAKSKKAKQPHLKWNQLKSHQFQFQVKEELNKLKKTKIKNNQIDFFI